MTTETEKSPRNRNHNTLSHKDFYKLARWVEESFDSLAGMTQIQIADMAAGKINMTVTAHNIAAVAKTLGITIGRVIKPKVVRSKDTGRTLAQAIVALCEELGVAVSLPVRAIADR